MSPVPTISAPGQGGQFHPLGKLLFERLWGLGATVLLRGKAPPFMCEALGQIPGTIRHKQKP